MTVLPLDGSPLRYHSVKNVPVLKKDVLKPFYTRLHPTLDDVVRHPLTPTAS